MGTQQPLLDLFNQEYNFDNYITIGNEITIANLRDFTSQYTHIYGSSLTGKTHLLQAWINLARQRKHNAIYLQKQHLIDISLNELDLDLYRFIAIDDIDLLDETQQISLFDLFNHIKLNNRNNYLLTSSTINLNKSNLRVDLKTRIHSGLIFALKSLNEDDLLAALSIYAKREGIKVGDAELKYLLNHYTRNLGKLIKLINNASILALSTKKQISIALLKACFE